MSAAHGHFLTQVIKNRPYRVNQPILDYLNQAGAEHGNLALGGSERLVLVWFMSTPQPEISEGF